MFELNEEQRIVENVFRQFSEKELYPQVEKFESGEALPYDLMRKMNKELMGGDQRGKALIDRLEKGERGSDSAPQESRREDTLISSIILKELSRVSPGFCMSWGASIGLCGGNIASKGTPDQIRKYAVPVITMEKIGAWGLTEPGAGSDAIGSMRTTAKPEGEFYKLNGSKTFITNAPYADTFLIYAKIDRGQPRQEQQAHGFILERGMKGLSTGKPLKKMGMKDSPTGEIFMEDVMVPANNLLGGSEKQGGRDEVRMSLGNERSGISPMCLGIIEKCYELSIKYAKERIQFGRPIGEFQAIQLKLADMYIGLKNSWDIIFHLAWMSKTGKRDMAYVCAAKVYTARTAVQAALDAIQIHGGYGYMEEYRVEKLMRDAKLLEIGAGTTDINALYAARLELGLA